MRMLGGSHLWSAPLAGLVGLLLAGAAPTAGAQVAVLDAWTLARSSAPNSTNINVNAGNLSVSAGAQRLFLVAAVLEASASGTIANFNATLGGVALAALDGSEGISGRETAKVWYFIDAQIPAGAAALVVTGTHQQTVTGLHIYWGSYAGVDQVTPVNSSNANYSGATNVTFGATINYVADGQTFYAAGNGGSAANITHVAGFSTQAASTGNGHSSFMGATAVHAANGSYAGTSQVSFSGTVSNRSAIVVASLRPGSNNATAAGTVTAAAASCSAITVGATYTGDANGNNTLSYRTRTPSGTGAWSAPTSVPHSASPYGFNVTGLTFGGSYDVEVTYVDPDGVTGTNPQTVSGILVGANCTGAGTPTADQTTGATPSIAVSAPYTFDNNGNNTLSYRTRTPSGTGAWSAPTNLPHAASPYAFTLAGLTCGSTYDVEVTYNDADGLGAGTQVQTVSAILLNNCTTTGTLTAAGSACGSIAVSAAYTQDANADNTLSYRTRTPSGTGAWVGPTVVAHSASPYSFAITGLAAGTYDVEVTYVDADGLSGTNPRTVTGLTVSANCTSVGTATAAAVACTQIDVSAPFSGDANSNSATQVEYNTVDTWPGTTACANLAGPSPRTCALSGLANAGTYWIRVTFTDADGTTGTNPQVIGPLATLDCRVTPQPPLATADACDQVTVNAPFAGDADGDSRTSVSRGTSAGGPFPTAVCVNLAGASPRNCIDSGVVALTTYYYQVTFSDPDGVVGSATQVTGAVTPPACSIDNTTAGTLSALGSACNAVTTSVTFTGDENNNGSSLIEYNTTNTWPGTTVCAATSGASPRQCLVSGLGAGTTYWFRATFNDPDGVAGTNPTAAVSASTLPTCGSDTMPPTITVLIPGRNAILAGADTAKVQVYDAVGLAATNPVQWQLDATTLAGFGASGLAANANYNCGSGCTVYDIALPAAAAGPHYLALRASDAAGNVALVTWAFRSQPSGAGTILRRSTGSELCLDCHNLQTHNSQYTSTAYGNWAIDCVTCHTPHGTANIFLVRGQVQTPASGVKAVDFRNRSGVAAFSYATPSLSPNPPNPPGVCEACHTKTRNSDATPRARNNAWTDWTKHYSGKCTGCHPHRKGFAAGESEGGAECAGCHPVIWAGMTGAVAKVTRHTLGNVLGTNDSFTDTNVTWGSPLAGNAAALRSCVNMCHNDHPHTLDTPATATHENNAYMDATSQASRDATTRTGTDKDLTDFEAAAANGGMCLSCHRNPVDAAHPAIDKAAYTVSGHNTTVTTRAWNYTQHDGSNFQRNCTKCHADRNDGRPTATVTPFGAVHFSDYPSLLAGSTNPGNAPATFVCYNCHGNGTVGLDYSGKNIATQSAKTRNHPSNADNVHDSLSEFNNSTFGAGLGAGVARHANCLDCHNPHQAQPGTHATPGNLAGPPLAGAWGAQLASNPAFWTAPAAGNFIKKTIVAGTDVEATLCFKCHSAYYGALPTAPSGGPETDQAREFNPANVGNFAGTWASGETAGGFHPVLAAAGSNLGAVNLNNLVTTNLPWSTSSRNLMTCTDCHESETVADPNGPHGSTANYILRGPNTGWAATTTQTSTGMPAGTFCANCHSPSFTSSRFSQHFSRSDHRVACWNCHAAVPHGGPRPGMLIAPAGATANVGGSIAGWDTTAPYWGLGTSSNKLYLTSYPANNTTAWSQNNCGCNGTGH